MTSSLWAAALADSPMVVVVAVAEASVSRTVYRLHLALR